MTNHQEMTNSSTLLHLQQLLDLLFYPTNISSSSSSTTTSTSITIPSTSHAAADADAALENANANITTNTTTTNNNANNSNKCFNDMEILLKRPAIKWKRIKDKDKDDTTTMEQEEEEESVYWRPPSSFSCAGHDGWKNSLELLTPKDDDDMDTICRTICHKDLLVWIRLFLYQFLLHCTKEKNEDEKENKNKSFGGQPIVAVGIPEGPYLAITILSLFVLNVVCGGENETYCTPPPIILPLDPEEGHDRLRHMCKDAKPSMVLYVRPEDRDEIMKCSGSATTMTNFYNVRDWLQEQDTCNVPLNVQLDTIRSCCNPHPFGLSFSPFSSSSEKEEEGEDSLDHCHRHGHNHISHIVYTSGTTGNPKGCQSSIHALLHYIQVKNRSHGICYRSNVFLASALPFDPCLSDIIATWCTFATLSMPRRRGGGGSSGQEEDLGRLLQELGVTHVLCTPSLWSGVVMRGVDESGEEDGRNGTREGGGRGFLDKLQVVALGGECMSRRMREWWGRKKVMKERNMEKMEGIEEYNEGGKTRLLSTYGVTEACVYQTIGEVFADEEEGEEEESDEGEEEENGNGLFEKTKKKKGYDIGLAMEGLEVIVWKECKDNGSAVNWETAWSERVVPHGSPGELVLKGCQLDEFSGYLNMPEVTRQKFLLIDGEVYYRTGDRGYIHPKSGHLFILGRIGGEEGMVKINGIRVELGEIEHSIMDSIDVSSQVATIPIVIGCIVSVLVVDDEGHKKLTAYCVLSNQCLQEVGVTSFPPTGGGIICSSGPLLTLLRARCKAKVRKGCIPSNFVLIKRIPLTRTGKINRDALPPIETCISLDEVGATDGKPQVHLSEYGRCGTFVANELATCLNLHESQRKMITTTTNFAMLGGDSLAATRIVRALYASHHGLQNARSLGGAFGTFDGVFHASNLIRSNSLGEYVDLLDSSGVLSSLPAEQFQSKNVCSRPITKTEENQLYDALFQAITINQSTIAVSLLLHGANPNLKEHGKRLGNTSGRLEQRDTFHSNPMHLACVKGDLQVVRALLLVGHCNCKSPDSSGTFPIHLACSGLGDGIGVETSIQYSEHEDRQRLECVKLLLDVGKVPLPMKNSSKQSVLHCAARGGYCILLDYLLNRWNADESIKAVQQWGDKCDWQDR